jgi:4,5-dihydroxyphthalate decarboxylase
VPRKAAAHELICGGAVFIAIPVFPPRYFRSVALDLRYFTGGVDTVGHREKVPISLPDGIEVEPIGEDQTLSEMLSAGELEAVLSAKVPSCFYKDSHVKRLFPDYKAVEKEYFLRTGIFPVMHVVVIERSVLDSHSWVAGSRMKAFEQSLRVAKEELMYRSSLMTMLPRLADHVEETVSATGSDYWKYGIEANRHVLETFLRYSHRQGLAQKQWNPEEIFAASAAENLGRPIPLPALLVLAFFCDHRVRPTSAVSCL